MTASWRTDKRSSSERGYDGRWQKARRTFLAKYPVCERCEREGTITAATVVNHRIPHKGDQKLFWDKHNWEPTCKRHHDSDIKREEMSGIVKGTARDGRPTDPQHPWNRSGK